MDTQRVTVRNVATDAINDVRATAAFNGMTLGEAVTEALNFWLDNLDEVEEIEPEAENSTV